MLMESTSWPERTSWGLMERNCFRMPLPFPGAHLRRSDGRLSILLFEEGMPH